MLNRLGEVSSNNGELRKRRDLQAQEIAQLVESGRGQQQFCQDAGRRVEDTRQEEARVVEARLREEASATEARLRAEISELKARAQREREEMKRHAAERDAAKASCIEIESKFQGALQAPALNKERVAGVEMEMVLVRARLAKEVAAREAAEAVVGEVKTHRDKLQARLLHTDTEAKQLRRQVAEQAEQLAFREEVFTDLQDKMQQQRLDTERRLSEERSESQRRVGHERARREMTERLDCVLPRGFLAKAMD